MGLTSVAAIALGGQGSPAENANQARRALLRTTCEHLLSYTGADGTPFGGLRRVGDIIVLPFPPPSTTVAPPSAAQLTGKKRGPRGWRKLGRQLWLGPGQRLVGRGTR